MEIEDQHPRGKWSVWLGWNTAIPPLEETEVPEEPHCSKPPWRAGKAMGAGNQQPHFDLFPQGREDQLIIEGTECARASH